MSETPNPDEPRGIFDGFEGYRTVTIDDYRRVPFEGMVVPDANVLLNLYRYNRQGREDLLRVLKRLSDSLWVPHQVMEEFWRNRASATRGREKLSEKAIADLEGYRRATVDALRTWSNGVALPDSQIKVLQRTLDRAFASVAEAITAPDTENIADDTNADPVLQVLEPLLQGHIGPHFSPADQDRIAKEGLRRIQLGIPRDSKTARRMSAVPSATT